MIDYMLSTNWKWLFIIGGAMLLLNCVYYFFKFVIFLIKLSDLKTQLGELNSNLDNLRLDAAQLRRQVFNIEHEFKALKDSLPHNIKSIYDEKAKDKPLNLILPRPDSAVFSKR